MSHLCLVLLEDKVSAAGQDVKIHLVTLCVALVTSAALVGNVTTGYQQHLEAMRPRRVAETHLRRQFQQHAAVRR